MTRDEVMAEAKEKMQKAVEVFTHDMRGIRTGRATPGLVESVRVDYYGSPTPLKQIANISVQDPRTLVIKAFDSGTIKNIEKAIQKSELGLTPSSDGRLIRLSVPPLSEERRHQLVNQIKDMAEKAKVAIRNIRREANRQVDQMEKDSLLGKDDAHDLKEEVQDLTKKNELEVDGAFEGKKKEILEE